ncbi:DUF4835 family protein [Lacihabitans sp. LS3-19]|nr:DUF4835 family protein [Lacihabitans sp. LS3-19]
MKRILFFLSFLISGLVQAQELSCKVVVNSSQLKLSTSGDKQIFTEIEQKIKEFMNNQRWTNDLFSEKEKIKCSLIINLLSSQGQYKYSGNVQFQVIRPVYGTTYETVIFQFVDQNFEISYAPEDRQMIYNEQSYSSNFTSTLAFYSLAALVFDYDSFSKLGGNPYLERLFNVVTLAAGAGSKSPWTYDSDIRSRYWVMENLRNQQFGAFRDGFYEYHRLALDDFANNPANSRKIALEFLNTIKTVSTLKQNSIVINTFFDAKSDELINIFSEGSKKEKQEAFNIMSSLDPSKTDTYRKLMK